VIVGAPKEAKTEEKRVAMDPFWTSYLVGKGHTVLVEKHAGHLSGFEDENYKKAGAQIVDSRNELWSRSEFIVKVKEIQEEEYTMMHEGQIISAWFHLAEDYDSRMCTALKEAKVTTIALEQVVLEGNFRVTVVPMSEIAGWSAAIQMTKLLFELPESLGVALANFSGFGSARITILGGGTVGYFAARTLLGIGAEVTILEKNLQRIVELNGLFGGRVRVLYSNDENLRNSLEESVGLINAIYSMPGSKAMVTREHIKLLPERGVVVDVGGGGIAGSGTIETCHYTTLEDPTYTEEGRIHYCVDNIPAMFPRASSKMFINSSISYVIEIAEKGIDRALRENSVLRGALNFYKGKLVNVEVAERQNWKVSQLQLPTEKGS